MKDLLIGLDIGTSNIKAGLFDVKGRLLACAAHPIATSSPYEGWAEQDPNGWWAAVCRVLSEVTIDRRASDVAAVGLSGQCPGHVMVDAKGNPLGQAIIWRDQRARDEANWLAETITLEQSKKWVGFDCIGLETYPPARLLWLKNHEHENMARCSKILQPKDFIGLMLTNVAATDDSSAYCLYNYVNKKYEPAYFSALGIDIHLMPDVLLLTDVLGKVTKTAASATGLIEGTTVFCGTIDAYCDTLAGGAMIPGHALDVAGTSEIVSFGVSKDVEGEGVYCTTIGGAGKFLCAPTQSGGDTINWLARSLFPELCRGIDYRLLEKEASSAKPGCSGLVFLPYLNGERAPIWDANVRGGFLGLSFEHHRQHLARAVYEGVGFAIRQLLEICERVSGTKAGSIVICGGGSRSDFWNQMKADIFQRPVSVLEVSQTGCLGAAMLAGVGIGIYPDIVSANENMARIKTNILPNLDHAEKYEMAFRHYLDMYPAIKPLFTEQEGSK